MVGLFTDPVFYQIGTGDFLHAFFSTIAYRLENNNWGSRFPVLMSRLYNEKGIAHTECQTVLNELLIIKNECSGLPPDKVIWDIEDLSKQPPWENDTSGRITNLSNYFWTSDGENLFDMIEKALNASIELEEPLVIRSI